MKTIKTKGYFLTITLFFLTVLLFGQTKNIKEDCIVLQYDSITKQTIYSNVDSMPEFPGGIDSLNLFINNNLRWPEDNGAEYSGRVYISFIVETDGTLTNKKILRGIDKPVDDEALKLIEKMPKWKTGKCKGNPVSVRYIIPIPFTLGY